MFQRLADGQYWKSKVVNGALTFEKVRGDEESCSALFARLILQHEAEHRARVCAREFERNLATLERQRDVASIVRGMQQFAADEAVQLAACRSLLNFTPSVEGDEYRKIQAKTERRGRRCSGSTERWHLRASLTRCARRSLPTRLRLRVLGAAFSGCWRVMTTTGARSRRASGAYT
jgi:hypothetical protein